MKIGTEKIKMKMKIYIKRIKNSKYIKSITGIWRKGQDKASGPEQAEPSEPSEPGRLAPLKSVNFRRPLYILSAIVYLGGLIVLYFGTRIFSTPLAEAQDSSETTTYINTRLPEGNFRGDGIGNKMSSMQSTYGMIEDSTAVLNIKQGKERQQEEYESRYDEQDIELRRLNEEIQRMAPSEGQEQDKTAAQSKQEAEALKELEKALAQARLEAQAAVTARKDSAAEDSRSVRQKAMEAARKVEKSIEDDSPGKVVRKIRTSSDYFHTLASGAAEPGLIKAIIDENITAVDGSRVRLRLLDDVEVGDMTVPSGTYLYATMSGFSGQRVKGTVASVMVGEEIVRISLDVYDTDGLEGLYVPGSSFRETGKDVLSGAMSNNVSMSTSSDNSLSQWGKQAAQNAYQKTTSAISKAIKKNRVKLKYGTQVYLINSKERKTK